METEFLVWGALLFSLGGVLGWWLATFKEERRLGERFKSLSMEALKESNHLFLQLAHATLEKFHEKAKGEWEEKHQGVEELLKPVKASLEKFEGKIGELETVRVGAYAALREQVGALLESQKMLRLETTNLTHALRAPHVRGRWGEIQLRRVVELAGMLNHCDFFEQESIGEENRLRPDLLIKLPAGRTIVVDAKVPLASYLEAIETTDDSLRKQKMKEHARQVRAHMVHLGRKAYWEHLSSTVEFVVLFLPAETFFSAALEHDPALIEGGIEGGVIMATPTTLIALLKAVAYGWKQESITQNTKEISQLGKELYKRIHDMGGHFAKVGKSLDSAVDAYNKTAASLEARVLVSARRFKELESTGGEKEIEPLELIEKKSRTFMAD